MDEGHQKVGRLSYRAGGCGEQSVGLFYPIFALRRRHITQIIEGIMVNYCFD